jgi:beta-lactamase regulating signal transducer with metallopeptidase domain
MIAAWMLYCLLCALGLSFAAALAERVLLAGRGPVRVVWVGAVALSLLVPAAALRFASRPVPGDASPDVGQNVIASQILDTAQDASATEPREPQTRGRDWRAMLARLDQPLAVAWVALSIALALNFFAGVATLASMRRRWVRRVVLDVPVFVSERTGPAVVGVVAPSIVLPEWVLAMEPQQLSLMLRHEQEHQRAGDGQLLTAAELALIAMPWNVVLWWQILRLRVAVELDCDARVLRDADARSYANLLLEVARPRRGPSLMGAMAFAERATQLERRIRVLARHRVRTTRVARAGATLIALVTVTAAWVAPRPAAPAPSSSAAPSVDAMRVEPNAAMPSSDTLTLSNTFEIPTTNRTTRSGSPASTRAAGENSGLGAPVPPDPTLGRQGRGGDAQSVQDPVDAIFKRLFDGITLTPDQETRAREILTSLQREQSAQDLASASLSSARPRESVDAASAARFGAARSADERCRPRDVRREPVAATGCGRRGGPPPDASNTGQRGGGGGRGGGAGGGDTLDARFRLREGRGRGGGSVEIDGLRLLADTLIVDATYRRLFDGITLTPDQEASARALIASTQQEMGRQTMQREVEPLIIVDGVRYDNRTVQLRMNPRSGLVSIRPPNDSLLIALGSNDDDRAKLRSRIVSIPR